MKKLSIFFIILMVFCFSTNGRAQEKTNQLTLSYGWATVDDFANIFESVFEDIIYNIFGNDATGGDATSSGAILVSYQYSFSNLLSAGPVLSFEALQNDVKINGSKVGDVKHNLFTLAAEGRLNYVNKERFGMYFGLGAGATMVNTTTSSDQQDVDNPDPETHFAFQLTGLGMRFGDKIAVNAELGFGYRGLVNLGLSYRF